MSSDRSGDQLPELAVLILQLLQSLRFRRQQPVIFPVEIDCLADPRAAADLRHRNAVRSLLQTERLLYVRKLRCLHHSAPLPAGTLLRKTPILNGPVIWVQITDHEAMLRTVLQNGMQDGAFCQCDLHHKFSRILSVLNWMLRWLKLGGTKHAAEFASEYNELLVRGLLSRL